MQEQTPLELAKEMLRHSAECICKNCWGIAEYKPVAAALIERETLQAARIADLERENERLAVKLRICQGTLWTADYEIANRKADNADLITQLAQRDKALAESPHGRDCRGCSVEWCAECESGELGHLDGKCLNNRYSVWTPKPIAPCDCWKSRALAALGQKEPGA